jgi:putative peptidoglycan lipid II flippase
MNRTRLLTSILNASVLRLIGQAVALLSGILIANYYGASAATDDYYAALILPGAIANLALNILMNLFTPIYLTYIHKDPAQQRPILASMSFVTALSLILGTAISLAGVPLSLGLRDIQSPDLVTRAMVFSVIFALFTPVYGYIRLLGAVCEAHQRYALPAIASVINPIVFVTVLFTTYQRLNIYSLLLANLTGLSAELFIVGIFAVWKLHMPLLPRPRLHPAIREMLSLSLIPALTWIALFFVPTVDRAMASTIDAGSLTAFHYGERLVAVADQLLTSGVITVLTTHWANVAAQQGIEAVVRNLDEAVSLLCFVIIPAAVGGAVLSRPIISVFFERGAFTSVNQSAQVFAVLLTSLLFSSLIVLFVRLLLITWATRAQAALSIGVAVLNTVLNVLLAPSLGLLGIALSTLITRVLIAAASYAFVQRKIPAVNMRGALQPIGQTLLCTAAMIAVVMGLHALLDPALMRAYQLRWQIVALGGVVTAGIVTYVGAALLIRHQDLIALLHVAARTHYGFWLRRFGVAPEIEHDTLHP